MTVWPEETRHGLLSLAQPYHLESSSFRAAVYPNFVDGGLDESDILTPSPSTLRCTDIALLSWS